MPRDHTQISFAHTSSSLCVTTKRGKGKVLSRRSTGPSENLPVLRLTSFSQEDIDQGESDHYPHPRFASRLKSAWVACKGLDQVASLHQAHALMRAASPVKLNKTPLVAKLSQWTLDHLSKQMGQEASWGILCSLQKHNAFIETATGKNIFGSYYHVREPQTLKLSMTFGEYTQCAKQWSSKGIMFKNTIMKANGQQQIPSPLPHLASDLTQELHDHISWDWLQALQKLARFGSVDKVSLQSAGCDALCPAQYQTHERLLAQVTGSQRLLLIPADYAFDGMYPYPVHHPYDGYTMVDLEHPDLAQWPKTASVKGLCCILKPGDVVYLPAYWFVHAQHLEESNISLMFHMGAGMRARPPGCAPLQLSRHLEARVADLEGVSNVRHWLRLIGYCEEEEWIDLATVKGYRRIVMCQEVRDGLILNLTNAAANAGEKEDEEDKMQDWQRVVIAMCEGRLLPTPWLNKDFREPLYLTDTAVQLEDTRSAEERKYPQLFRRKLKAEGWTASESEYTIPIPGYTSQSALPGQQAEVWQADLVQSGGASMQSAHACMSQACCRS
ncbi:hypothetical protein WJX77_002084 [Trebouxia sp. C0004]